MALVVSLAGVEAGHAQTPPPATARSAPAATTTPGLKIGRFIFFPEITLSEIYDDNIFATPTNKTHDWITLISPSLRLQSNW